MFSFHLPRSFLKLYETLLRSLHLLNFEYPITHSAVGRQGNPLCVHHFVQGGQVASLQGGDALAHILIQFCVITGHRPMIMSVHIRVLAVLRYGQDGGFPHFLRCHVVAETGKGQVFPCFQLDVLDGNRVTLLGGAHVPIVRGVSQSVGRTSLVTHRLNLPADSNLLPNISPYKPDWLTAIMFRFCLPS